MLDFGTLDRIAKGASAPAAALEHLERAAQMYQMGVDSEDAVQEAALRLLEAGELLRPHPFAYFKRTIHNVMVTMVRREGRQRTLPLLEDICGQPDDVVDRVEARLKLQMFARCGGDARRLLALVGKARRTPTESVELHRLRARLTQAIEAVPVTALATGRAWKLLYYWRRPGRDGRQRRWRMRWELANAEKMKEKRRCWRQGERGRARKREGMERLRARRKAARESRA